MSFSSIRALRSRQLPRLRVARVSETEVGVTCGGKSEWWGERDLNPTQCGDVSRHRKSEFSYPNLW